MSQTIPSVSKIIFICDAKDGVLPADMKIAELLRQATPEKVILAVNKSDNQELDEQVSDFYKLGFHNPIPISSLHGKRDPGLAYNFDRRV